MPTRRVTSAPARCVQRDDGELGCSTRRWEERLILSERLFREAKRHPDLAALVRRLHQAHDRRLPPAVWLGYELATAVVSEGLGTELVAVSSCRSSAPPWAPKTKRPLQPGCRLYTYFGFREEV
jgi:hypothetical protein